MAPTGQIRIGISGWQYKPWRGVFYPPKLTQKKELAYTAGIFRSIEINGTFYSLQRPSSFEKWATETPHDFVFSIKAPRFITHILRLRDARTPLANFLASGLLVLGEKLGPILWQLPPNFLFDAKRIEDFLKLLPHDTGQAAALAKRHDKRMKGRNYVKSDQNRPLRHALEVRHRSFQTSQLVEILREYDVALVCADTVEWPRMMDMTSDFVYCRLHGSEELYASGYTPSSLDQWATRIKAWARGTEPRDAERTIDAPGPKLPARDIFVYFDNDIKVRAPFDAQSLMKRITT